MLIEFSIGNFLSFKDQVTLSLEASPDGWLEADHVATIGKYRLLKSAAIYGANASGKSNLLTGMRKFCYFVQTSSRESQIGEKIPVVPFRLHAAGQRQLKVTSGLGWFLHRFMVTPALRLLGQSPSVERSLWRRQAPQT